MTAAPSEGSTAGSLEVSALATLVDTRDLILVTGKGGTGKTTVVAELIRLALRRRRGAVGVEMSAHARLPAMIGVQVGAELVNIDAEQAAIASLGRLTGHPTLARAVLGNRILRSFIRTSPAMGEMIALDELVALVEAASRRKAPVIVDLPATGHALSFLQTPQAVHRMLRLGPFAEVAARVERLLLDAKRTELVVVSLPEELPVNETLELMRQASALGITSRTVVVNRVPSAPLGAGDRPLLQVLSARGDEAVARFAACVQTAMDGHDHARTQIDRLRSETGLQIVELPARAPGPVSNHAGAAEVEPPPGPATLSRLLENAPLVVCVGPGGVGKTTLSAVLALRQAAAGRRSLVLTIDPARRLADALSIAGLTNDPTELTSFSKMHPAGTLSALMLDPMATFDHMVAMLVTDPARRASLLGNRFYQHVSKGLAGTLEYMAIERLHQLQHTGRFDSIVLDTPPTTNALDFLEAPQRVTEFFGERVVRWLMPRTATTWTARLWNKAGSAALMLMSRVAGQSFVDETVAFLGAFGDLFGHFRARGAEIGALLRDPRTVFLVVAGPEPGRIAEARVIDERLTAAGCTPRAFLVNRVETPFLPSAGELEAGLARAAALLGGPDELERVREFVQRLETLRREQASTGAEHAATIDEVRHHAGLRPVFTVPRVPAGQSPRAALLAMYVGLFTPENAAPVVPPGGLPARPAVQPPVPDRRGQRGT